MNYYDVLGLKPTCSPKDIQTAYRNKAKQHHPDSGGDVDTFHAVAEAYEVLKDPHKRAAFDHRNSRRQNIKINTGNMDSVFDDMFTVFGGAGFHPSKREYHRARQNKNLAISIDCTLEEILADQEKTVSIRHTDGSRHLVNLKIPKGINSGTKIKYGALGDKTHANLPPGDLTVTVNVNEHEVFVREGDNLKMHLTLGAWDAIIGTVVQINTIENKTINLNVPAGTQYGATLRIPKHGMYSKQGTRGDLLVQVLVKIPENLTEQQLNICKKLRDDE
jgi:DnaJ-class molecular chaperone